MRSDVDAVSTLADAETEKLKALDGEYADNFALFRVHGELELSFKVFPAGFQLVLCGAFTFGEDDDVICVADVFHSAPFPFLVKLIEIDICQ